MNIQSETAILSPELSAKFEQMMKDKNIPTIPSSPTDLEVKSIKELRNDVIYHVSVEKDQAHPMALRMFAESAKALDLKMVITIGETTVENLAKTLGSLAPDQKAKILELLGYVSPINPLEHEQTK